MPSKAEIIEALQFSHIYRQPALNGSRSEPMKLSYQFADTARPDDLPDPTGFNGWTAFSETEKQSIRDALGHIETFLNVEFREVSGRADPDLNFAHPDLQSAGYPSWVDGLGGYWLSGTGEWDGYVLYDSALDLSGKTNLILHEIGHALGLDHPFDGVPLDPAYDNNHYTIMSYAPDPASGGFNEAMMLFDVLALQDIWGAARQNAGDSVYTGPRAAGVDLIWDSGGRDILDASARAGAVSLDLRAGSFSRFGSHDDLAIGYGVVIEEASGGAGDDAITGGTGGNRLWGNAGDDEIRGLGRNDALWGGAGNDRLAGDGGNDRLIGGDGDDDLQGGARNDVLKGGDGGDLLDGGGGRDRLFGGAGDDWLIGGAGADMLRGQAGADVFLFLPGSGLDVVRDFVPGEDLLRFEGFASLEAVLDAAAETGGDLVFDFGADRLVVSGLGFAAVANDIVIG